MKIHQHDNYEDYRSAQIEKNIKKFDTVWAKTVEIKACCDHMLQIGVTPVRGLCHGVRNGWEVKEFERLLPGCLVIGTDISPTANNIYNGVQYDFHDEKAEWLEKMDFIYSNSLDHAYDPRKALVTWRSQLAPKGIIFVGWFEKNGIDKADCFLASNEEVEELLENTVGSPRMVCTARKGYIVLGAQIA